MALDRTKVLQVAPEFTALGAKIDPFIDDAKLQLDATVWGKFYDVAGAYLVAHLLTLSHPANASPPSLQSETLAGVGRTYEATTMINPPTLQRTRYGREYMRLLRARGLGVQVA